MHFTIHTLSKGVRASIVLIPPEGEAIKYTIQLDFLATNNVSEYEGPVT
jgi:hypothetical protein